jgi:Ca-activated chloride channel family protein
MLVAAAGGTHFDGMRLVTFSHPQFLWLTPVAAVVVWWWVRRSWPALRFSDTSLFAGPRGRRARLACWGGALLRGLTCLALVLACAGPRLPDERTRLPADAVAIVMVMDVSNSMEAMVPWAVGQPPIKRLEAARRAFKLFVEGGDAPDGTKFEPRPSDQIGLIALYRIPELVCPLTLNHSVLLKMADELEPKFGIHAGTNIGDAIALATIRLEATSGAKTKVIILLSDGEHIQTREGKDAELMPRPAAQLTANLNYKIYTIDAGGEPAAIADPQARADRELGRQALKDVAEMTGGRAFDPTDGTGMLAAYKEIDDLERVKVEAPLYRRYFEFYWWCSAAALVCMLSVHMLERTFWRVVP